jgi:hypothetical protein
MVFFALGSTRIDAEAQQVISQAASEYKRGGQPQVTVTGHTDTTGSAEYNQRLSERRAEAVRAALEREGVPSTSIVTMADGQQDLLVPTGDNVLEPLNRRVVVNVPQAPAPAPVAEAPPPPPPQPMQEEQPKRWTFAIGPVYGHNFGETDNGGKGGKTENDLIGAELTFNALPSFLGGVSIKQMVLAGFNGVDNGVNGRTVAALNFAPAIGNFRPRLAANFGGVYGPGFQNGLVAGPEIGFDVTPWRGFTVGLKGAYDYQFRNAGWDEGVLWGGLDLGWSF